MRRVELERDDRFSIPVIGLGTYHLLDRMNEETAAQAIVAAQAVGINLIDTSDNYFNEGFIGEVMANSEAPDQFFIASKTGLAVTYEEHVKNQSDNRRANTSPERIKKQVTLSAAALGRSSIDLYQLHAYDDQSSAEDVVITMNELLEDGVINFYGVSNYLRPELEELLAACDKLGLQRPTTIQPYYHMLNDHDSDQGIDIAQDEGLVVLAHSPIMKGYLTDRSLDEFDEMLQREFKTMNHPKDTLDRLQAANNEVHRLRDYANSMGYTLSEYALAWLTNQPMTVALNACVKPEHLKSSTKAADWQIDTAGMNLAEEVRTNPNVIFSAGTLLKTAEVSRPYYDKRRS